MTAPDLDAIRARAEAATRGAWYAEEAAHGNPTNGPDHIRIRDGRDENVAEFDYSRSDWRNAEFIAHARTDVPALLAMLEQERAMRAEAERRQHVLKGAHRSALDTAGAIEADLRTARAEVERLREEVSKWRASFRDISARLVAALPEVERLERGLLTRATVLQEGLNAQRARAEKAEAQVQAVRALADGVTAAGPPDGGTDVCQMLHDLRAALDGADPDAWIEVTR